MAAGIRKRTDGTYEGRLVKRYTDGTKKRISIYGLSRSEVQDKLSRERVTKRRTANPETMPVSEFLENVYLPSIKPLPGIIAVKPRVRMSTYEIRERAVRLRLVPKPFGAIRLSEITRSDVVRLFNDLEASDPTNPRARQMAFETLRAAMNAALDRDLIESNPTTRVAKPGHRAKVTHRMSQAEIFKLLDAAERPIESKHSTKVGPYRCFAILHLLLATGLREGEAFALHKSDFDPSTGDLRVTATLSSGERTPPKTDSSVRTILVDRVTKSVLEAHLKRLESEGDSSPWLFPTTAGLPQERTKFAKRTFQPMLVRAELTGLGITPHALRHTAATMMQSEGVPAFMVAAILGHRPTGLLGRVYTGVTSQMQRDAAKIIANFFSRRGVKSGVENTTKSDTATVSGQSAPA